jgi:amino acid adenylation domain-containing protein
MVEYRGMVNHLWIKIDDLQITSNDNIAQTATQSFDVSVWQFLAALIVGGTTIIFKDSQAWEPSELLPLIKQKKITIFQTVPSHMQAILEDVENRADKARQLIGLRLLVFSGEALSFKICNRWLTLYSNIPVINAYGPTECSDDVSHYEVSNIRDNNLLLKTVPIGKVLGNCKIYILDNNLNLLPIRTVGELYIGGDGVGRGYLNRPELTAERFIANPFQTKKEKDDKKYGKAGRNVRIYKTGDLVRWLPDGNLEYIGRNDFQVKIRGYRIELGEIETVLSSYEGIKQSVVLAKDHTNIDGTVTNNKYLVGYYVSDSKLDEDNILNYLQTKLPEYMVPSILVYLKELPLTINGKLDRKALPDPEFTNSESYVAPRNEIEKQVCQIWSEVLGLAEDKVGIRDNFFKLGGNSIIAIRLISKLNKELNTDITLSLIFVQNTIDKLAKFLKYNFEESDKPLFSIIEEGEL